MPPIVVEGHRTGLGIQARPAQEKIGVRIARKPAIEAEATEHVRIRWFELLLVRVIEARLERVRPAQPREVVLDVENRLVIAPERGGGKALVVGQADGRRGVGDLRQVEARDRVVLRCLLNQLRDLEPELVAREQRREVHDPVVAACEARVVEEARRQEGVEVEDGIVAWAPAAVRVDIEPGRRIALDSRGLSDVAAEHPVPLAEMMIHAKVELGQVRLPWPQDRVVVAASIVEVRRRIERRVGARERVDAMLGDHVAGKRGTGQRVDDGPPEPAEITGPVRHLWQLRRRAHLAALHA